MTAVSTSREATDAGRKKFDLHLSAADEAESRAFFASADASNSRNRQRASGDQTGQDRSHDHGDRSAASPTLRELDVERMLTTPPPPVLWLARPVLVRGVVTMMGGREGRGKSMLALALAAAIGRGSVVAGIECAQGRTLYVDAENGEHEAHRRLHGLGVERGTLHYRVAEGFDLAGDLAELEQLIADVRPDVLVLDSLRSLAPSLDENDSRSAEAHVGPLRVLAERYGVAILLLHHASRGGDYRGSTGLGAAVQGVFILAQHDDDPQATRRVLTCRKLRPAAQPEPIWFDIRAGDDGGIDVATAEPYRPASERPPTKGDSHADALVRALTERGEAMRWGDLARAASLDPEDRTATRARDGDPRIERVQAGVYGLADESVSQSAPLRGDDRLTDSEDRGWSSDADLDFGDDDEGADR